MALWHFGAADSLMTPFGKHTFIACSMVQHTVISKISHYSNAALTRCIDWTSKGPSHNPSLKTLFFCAF